MRALLQRVSRAEVRVEGAVVGRIERGLLVLVGFTAADTEQAVDWMADKVCDLRVFGDAQGKMNLSVVETGGAVLAVSQFTLYGDAHAGRRPSFIGAARPEVAEPLYERFVAKVGARGIPVQTGKFGAMMDVELVNDGPVTLWLER